LGAFLAAAEAVLVFIIASIFVGVFALIVFVGLALGFARVKILHAIAFSALTAIALGFFVDPGTGSLAGFQPVAGYIAGTILAGAFGAIGGTIGYQIGGVGDSAGTVVFPSLERAGT
jgi:hypothetical protein